MESQRYFLLIDNCATEEFASLDLVSALQGTEFQLAYTPDLQMEYVNALSPSALTPSATRNLITTILAVGAKRAFFGWGGGAYLGWGEGIWANPDQIELVSRQPNQQRPDRPGKRTDLHLVALAKDDIVITCNKKEGHWKRAPEGRGLVIQWDNFKVVLQSINDIASAIRAFLPEPFQVKRES
jgi:hypothetical protein